MAYGDFKDLPRRTTADRVLCDKAFSNAKNPKYYQCQTVLASMVYHFFDNKTYNTKEHELILKSEN